MKNTINLMPWRFKLHQERSQFWLKMGIHLLLLFTGGYLLLTELGYRFAQERIQLQENQQHIQLQLSQTEQQLRQLQARIPNTTTQKGKSAVEISLDFIEPLFALLTEFPIGNGVLHSLQFSGEKLTLKGESANQGEFEQLYEYLKSYQGIKDVELSHFTPQNNGKLHFEFELELITAKGNE